MHRSKVVQDPVHGSIEVDGVFLDVMDRHEMQRLRSVKQLGLGNLVFPAANHTRFEHCLGTYHLAGRMADAIGLGREDSDAVRMAGMLHDICHPPFSHALEPIMEDATGLDHMELARALIMGDIPNHLSEYDDVLGGRPTIAETIEAEGISADAVCGIIAHPESTGEEALDRFWNKHEYFPSRDYAHQIIRSGGRRPDGLPHEGRAPHGRLPREHRLREADQDHDGPERPHRPPQGRRHRRRGPDGVPFADVHYCVLPRDRPHGPEDAHQGGGERRPGPDIYLKGDSDLMAMVEASGGKPARNIHRIKARMLDKKAFAVYSDDMTEEKAEVLLKYTGREGAARLEQEVADAAGVDVFDVGAEVTSSANLQGRVKIGKTDVAIADDGGRIKSLARFSPIARSLQARDPFGWAVLISAPKEERDAVRRAASKVLGF